MLVCIASLFQEGDGRYKAIKHLNMREKKNQFKIIIFF